MQRPVFVFRSHFFKSKFFEYLFVHFLRRTHIIQFSHAFLRQIFKQFFKINFCVLAEEIMAAKIAEVINLFTISDSKICGGTTSSFCVGLVTSYLTIYVSSPNHYDLEVQLHELVIFIRCTL